MQGLIPPTSPFIATSIHCPRTGNEIQGGRRVAVQQTALAVRGLLERGHTDGFRLDPEALDQLYDPEGPFPRQLALTANTGFKVELPRDLPDPAKQRNNKTVIHGQLVQRVVGEDNEEVRVVERPTELTLIHRSLLARLLNSRGCFMPVKAHARLYDIARNRHAYPPLEPRRQRS